MKNVRWLMIFTIALFCSGFSGDETWVIDPESKLAIHGATNVNRFTCELISYSGQDTLRYFNNHNTSKLEFTSNRMTIPIRNFDCGSSQISRDFYKTLKSDTYPKLDITFVSLENTCKQDNSRVQGVLDITLAGTTTRYNVQFTLNIKNGTMLLSGTQPMKFTDFKLKAPEKFKGLIRVQEGLKVEFHLVLKAV